MVLKVTGNQAMIADISNSDILYINDFAEEISRDLYTKEKKLTCLKTLKKVNPESKEVQWKFDNSKVCGSCY